MFNRKDNRLQELERKVSTLCDFPKKIFKTMYSLKLLENEFYKSKKEITEYKDYVHVFNKTHNDHIYNHIGRFIKLEKRIKSLEEKLNSKEELQPEKMIEKLESIKEILKDVNWKVTFKVTK